MKYLMLAAGAVFGLSSMAMPAAAETPLMGPIHQFLDSFDKGDQKTAAKAFAPTGVVIIDEFPPHLWAGPRALSQWSKDLVAANGKQGLAAVKVTLGTATREDIDGDSGYVVVPAVFSFTEKGTAKREAAQMVYTLKQAAGHWLITGWAWTGGTIQPAEGPAQ
jgi:hypothetical protein